jgi:Carbon dioxide concentrating mechanism/carboxysome shell protein
MNGYALGLIETRGKLAAIEAADVALKSANVALCGVENATGALITVKVVGDVGAVRAAVDAARVRASLLGEVVATQVLPRPATGIMPMVKQFGTVVEPLGSIPEDAAGASLAAEPSPVGEESAQAPDSGLEESFEPETDTQGVATPSPSDDGEPVSNADAAQAATCNICMDPACPRRKGEPAKRCVTRKRKGS